MTHVWTFTYLKNHLSSALDEPGVRTILSSYLPKDYYLQKTTTGKPYAKSESQKCAHFTISHSGDVLILAVDSNGPIGVDIEFNKKRTMAEKIAKKYFSRDEQDEEQFYRAWTAREAFTKAIGQSISKTISKIKISYTKEGALIGMDHQLTHRVEFFSIDPGSIGAICQQRGSKAEPLEFFRGDFKTLNF